MKSDKTNSSSSFLIPSSSSTSSYLSFPSSSCFDLPFSYSQQSFFFSCFNVSNDENQIGLKENDKKLLEKTKKEEIKVGKGEWKMNQPCHISSSSFSSVLFLPSNFCLLSSSVLSARNYISIYPFIPKLLNYLCCSLFKWTPTKIILLFVCINFFVYVDRGIIPGANREFSIFITWHLHINNPDFYIGILQSSFIAGLCIASPIFGFLAKFYHPFRLICFGIFVWISAVIISGFSGLFGSFYFLLFGRILSGIGEASFISVVPSYIADHTQKNKGKWLSVFYSMIAIGSSCGIAFGSIISNSSWRWPMAYISLAVLSFPFCFFSFILPLNSLTPSPQITPTCECNDFDLLNERNTLSFSSVLDNSPIMHPHIYSAAQASALSSTSSSSFFFLYNSHLFFLCYSDTNFANIDDLNKKTGANPYTQQGKYLENIKLKNKIIEQTDQNTLFKNKFDAFCNNNICMNINKNNEDILYKKHEIVVECNANNIISSDKHDDLNFSDFFLSTCILSHNKRKESKQRLKENIIQENLFLFLNSKITDKSKHMLFLDNIDNTNDIIDKSKNNDALNYRPDKKNYIFDFKSDFSISSTLFPDSISSGHSSCQYKCCNDLNTNVLNTISAPLISSNYNISSMTSLSFALQRSTTQSHIPNFCSCLTDSFSRISNEASYSNSVSNSSSFFCFSSSLLTYVNLFYRQLVFLFTSINFLYLVLGSSSYAAVLQSISTFGCSFLISLRYFQNETFAAFAMGGIAFTAGVLGTYLGGLIVDIRITKEGNISEKVQDETNNSEKEVDEKHQLNDDYEYCFMNENSENSTDIENMCKFKEKKASIIHGTDLNMIRNACSTANNYSHPDQIHESNEEQENKFLLDGQKRKKQNNENKTDVLSFETLAIVSYRNMWISSISFFFLFFASFSQTYLIFPLLFVGLTFLFATQAGTSIGVMESIPKDSRAFGLAVGCLLMHIFGDVPGPIVIGWIKNWLAPHCTFKEEFSNCSKKNETFSKHFNVNDFEHANYVDISNVESQRALTKILMDEKCWEERKGLRMTLSILFCWIGWLVLGFYMSYCNAKKKIKKFKQYDVSSNDQAIIL